VNVKKKMYEFTNFDFPSSEHNFKLPKLGKFNNFGKYKSKFRAAVWCVIFIKRLKTKL